MTVTEGPNPSKKSATDRSRMKPFDVARTLRQEGATWVGISAVMRHRFGFNGLAAMRVAHAWSQRQAADHWNQLWPQEPKTLKNISYWENWPSRSGYAPSLAVLGNLAELYQCRVADLLVDGPDYRSLDSAFPPRRPVLRGPSPTAIGTRLDSVFDQLLEADIEEIAGTALVWARSQLPVADAHPVLMRLSAGLALAAHAHAAIPLTDREAAEVAAGKAAAEAKPARRAGEGRLAGLWRSRYECGSARRTGGGDGEHSLVFRELRGRLVGRSLPHSSGSQLRLELAVDGSVVIGTWREQAAAVGRGGAYYGCVQLELDALGKRMQGRWIGFGNGLHPQAGTWELTWIDSDLSGRALRASLA